MLKRLTHQVRSFESVWADVCSGDAVIFVGEHFHILFNVVASSAGDCQWSASYSRWLKGEVLSWGNYQRLAGVHLGVGLGTQRGHHPPPWKFIKSYVISTG